MTVYIDREITTEFIRMKDELRNTIDDSIDQRFMQSIQDRSIYNWRLTCIIFVIDRIVILFIRIQRKIEFGFFILYWVTSDFAQAFNNEVYFLI